MSFREQINTLTLQMQAMSELVHTEKWQGVDISKKPEMATHELRHVQLRADMETEDLEWYRDQIEPNLPWADDHFAERVCGYPINPGVQWAKWPQAHSAKSFLNEEGMFNHNYMERYFPKYAGTIGATANAEDFARRLFSMYGDDFSQAQNNGINHPYGDLFDVVKQLHREPHTRQAILPVFFPEDTGAVHQGRIPCSLFYQFFMRNNRMDVVYYLRSCDLRRHVRDDIYLTVRLVLWVIDRLREMDEKWRDVVPGEFVMNVTSLHIFRNDYYQMFGSK